MAATSLSYGVPDIALPRIGGGEINPAAFVGHELVVFFCPVDPAEAASEVESFRARATDFADCAAWLIGILSGGLAPLPPHSSGEAEITLAWDPTGAGWSLFESLLDPAERSEERNGGTFVFVRGGSLAEAWPGAGHADDALAALTRRI